MITQFEQYNEGLFSSISFVDKKFNKLVDDIKKTFDPDDLKQVYDDTLTPKDGNKKFKYVYNNVAVYFYTDSEYKYWQVWIDGKKYDVSSKPAKKLFQWFDNNKDKNINFKLKKEQPIFNSRTGERIGTGIPMSDDTSKPTLGIGQKIKKFLD